MIEWSIRHGALLAMLLCAAPGPAAPQTPPGDGARLTLGLGTTFDAHTDLLASPFRQSGVGWSVDLGFSRGGFSADLHGTVVGTSSSLDGGDDGIEDGWTGALDVVYLRPVGAAGRTRWRVGGGISGLAFVRRHHYGSGASREYFADLVVPLSAVGEVSRAFGSTLLEERVGGALAGVLFRSPWSATKTFPSGSLAGPGSLRLFRHRLRATWRMSPRVRFVLTHEATFYDTDRHRLARVLQQRIAAGLDLGFGGAP